MPTLFLPSITDNSYTPQNKMYEISQGSISCDFVSLDAIVNVKFSREKLFSILSSFQQMRFRNQSSMLVMRKRKDTRGNFIWATILRQFRCKHYREENIFSFLIAQFLQSIKFCSQVFLLQRIKYIRGVETVSTNREEALESHQSSVVQGIVLKFVEHIVSGYLKNSGTGEKILKCNRSIVEQEMHMSITVLGCGKRKRTFRIAYFNKSKGDLQNDSVYSY